MKILTVIGARPQFIKAATVSRAIQAWNNVPEHEQVQEIIVHTGQHFDPNMSAIFFEQMSIPTPNYNLNINGLSHGAMTGQMLEKVEEVILQEQPDWVLVYGDTNSTLAGALAAKKLHYKVAHIEAGLRSFNLQMPEEINRILTDRISNILFCPTSLSLENLNLEGFDHFDSTCIVSGDVMYDAAMFYRGLQQVPQLFLDQPSLLKDGYILATFHRAENTDNESRLREITQSLIEISQNIPVVVPIHPRTAQKLIDFQINFNSNNLHIIEPVGYLEIIPLIENSKLVVTDSGGLQKEAFFFHTPCVTLREETEWIELIDGGFNQLAGTNKEQITTCIQSMLAKELDFEKPLYGSGNSAQLILEQLIQAS